MHNFSQEETLSVEGPCDSNNVYTIVDYSHDATMNTVAAWSSSTDYEDERFITTC